MNWTKVGVIAFFTLICVISSSFKSANSIHTKGVFSFMLNNKLHVIEGVTAKYRTVTGGYKQLSISNDLFTSFFFNNPTQKTFELNTKSNKEAIIRYTNPANLVTFYPEKGKVSISNFDNVAHLLSGNFEIEMYQKDQPSKKISITNGKFINVPILDK